jgi:hypothetical protein
MTVSLLLQDPTGADAGLANLVIPPDRTAVVNTVGMGVARDSVGNARLTHDGPPGAIVAVAAIANFTSTPAYVQPVKFLAVRD